MQLVQFLVQNCSPMSSGTNATEKCFEFLCSTIPSGDLGKVSCVCALLFVALSFLTLTVRRLILCLNSACAAHGLLRALHRRHNRNFVFDCVYVILPCPDFTAHSEEGALQSQQNSSVKTSAHFIVWFFGVCMCLCVCAVFSHIGRAPVWQAIPSHTRTASLFWRFSPSFWSVSVSI